MGLVQKTGREEDKKRRGEGEKKKSISYYIEKITRKIKENNLATTGRSHRLPFGFYLLQLNLFREHLRCLFWPHWDDRRKRC